MASAAVSPALGIIAAAFPNASPMLIRLIITLPAMTIIPSALVSGKLSEFVGKKMILYVGFAIYILGGVGGGMISNLSFLLGMRALLGIGVGLIMPVSTALVTDFFKGDEAAKMTGWVTASNNMGGIIAVILSGWLATFSWRYSFIIYSMGIVAVVFVACFLPEPEMKKHPKVKAKNQPGVTYIAAFAAFAMMTIFYAIPTNIAIFLQESRLGDAKTAGFLLAMVNISAFVSGTLFARIQNFFKHYMVALQVAIMASGFFMLTGSPMFSAVFVGVSLIGFSFGSLYPTIILLVVKGVPRELNTKAMGILSGFLFSGQFFSPLFFETFENLTPYSGISTIFMFSACLLGGVALLFFLNNIMGKSRLSSAASR